MKHKNRKKHRARLLTAVFAAVMLLSLLPITVSARENGHTVLTEDHYNLSDSNAAKVPGLSYECKGHGRLDVYDGKRHQPVTDDDMYAEPISGYIERQ